MGGKNVGGVVGDVVGGAAEGNRVGEVAGGTTIKLETGCNVCSLVGFCVLSSVSIVRGGVGIGIGCSDCSSVSTMGGGFGIGRNSSVISSVSTIGDGKGIGRGSSIGPSASVRLQLGSPQPSTANRKLDQKTPPIMIKATIQR
jgi:hypothetical protein